MDTRQSGQSIANGVQQSHGDTRLRAHAVPPGARRLRAALMIAMLADAATIVAQPSLAATDLRQPGQSIDIGGRRLHLHCIDSGQPTVLFEPSFTQFALDWWFVQPEVAKTTRACSYDRAGLGWSDPGPHSSEHPEQVVRDLHTLLEAAGEKPPFVLVSMSMGAFYTRAYHLAYGRDVAGFIFIEPAHEDSFLVPIDGTLTPLWNLSADQAASAARSMYSGPRPPPPPLSSAAPFDRLPASVLKARLAFEQRAFAVGQAETIADIVADVESRRVTAARLHAAGAVLSSLPVVVLASDTTTMPSATEAHLKIAALSTNSTRRVVRTGHMVHLEAPSLVVSAVADVVEAVRSKRSVAP